METLLNRVFIEQFTTLPLSPPHITVRLAFIEMELLLFLAAHMHEGERAEAPGGQP